MKNHIKTILTLAFLLLSGPAFAKSTVMPVSVDHGVPLSLNGSAASVFIANPEIADVQLMSPSQVMIFGKRTGTTSFMATDSGGHTLAERTVVVLQDLAGLRDDLDLAIPGNKIHAKAVPNGIVLTGEATDPASVADAYKIAMRYMPAGGDIINRIQIAGSNQIQIRVRFAEVQRNIDNTLGFDWQNAFKIGGYVIGMASGNAVNAQGTGTFNQNETTGLFPRPNNTALNLPNDVLGATSIGSHVNINAMIDALAQDGLVTILAEPNLTAMSGETANFLAGGEFPIPIPQGNGTISITFKSYGISLSFTPTLLSGNRVSLHVRPEVSELTDTGAIVITNITIPALTTRKAETTVEVTSGESFAIAGLLSNNQAQTVNKFPLLGDLPVLGNLFRSDRYINGQTELVVIITPYIVRPSGQKLALPTDGLVPPSELDRLAKRRFTGSDPTGRPISGEPTAEIAAPALTAAPAPAPTAAPLAPVDSAPVQPTSVQPAPLSTPLVLHPKGEDRSGGLMVE